jgi:hypothetical protein
MNNDLYYGIVKHLATGEVPDNIDKETQRMVKKVSDLYTLDKNKLYKSDESRNGTLDNPRGRQH